MHCEADVWFSTTTIAGPHISSCRKPHPFCHLFLHMSPDLCVHLGDFVLWKEFSWRHFVNCHQFQKPRLLYNLKGHHVFGNEVCHSIVQVFSMFWCGCIGDLFLKCLLNGGLTCSFWRGCPFTARATAALKRRKIKTDMLIQLKQCITWSDWFYVKTHILLLLLPLRIWNNCLVHVHAGLSLLKSAYWW